MSIYTSVMITSKVQASELAATVPSLHAVLRSVVDDECENRRDYATDLKNRL